MCRALGLGGSERQLTAIAKTLDRDKFDPHVGFTYDEGIRAADLRDAGIPVVRFPLRSFRSPSCLAATWRLGRYIQRNRISVVHPFDFPSVLFAVPVSRVFGAPVVLASQRGELAFFSRPWQRVFELMDRIADGVVVNSHFLRRELMEFHGMPERRIHLCYNGIDTIVFHPQGRCRTEPLKDADCVIGAVSVLRPEKSLDTLIRAFAAVRPHYSRLKLAIVGDGDHRPGLLQLAGQLRVIEDCVFVPATKDVAEWYRSIDIYVLPSLTEAFSNSLMEAMACGCTPVATNVGGNPEVVRHGETGLLFPAGDVETLARELRRLIDDQVLRARLSDAASRLIEAEFTLDVASDRMGAIYQQYLSRWRVKQGLD